MRRWYGQVVAADLAFAAASLAGLGLEPWVQKTCLAAILTATPAVALSLFGVAILAARPVSEARDAEFRRLVI